MTCIRDVVANLLRGDGELVMAKQLNEKLPLFLYILIPAKVKRQHCFIHPQVSFN
jgi:hypothetical protein